MRDIDILYKFPWIAGHWLNKEFLWHPPVAIKGLKMPSLHGFSLRFTMHSRFGAACLSLTLPGCTNFCMDCQLSDWTGWSKCSKSCEGGIQHRLRDEVQLDFTWQNWRFHTKSKSHKSPLLWKPCKRPTCPGTCNAGQHSVPQTDLTKKRVSSVSRLFFCWL